MRCRALCWMKHVSIPRPQALGWGCRCWGGDWPEDEERAAWGLGSLEEGRGRGAALVRRVDWTQGVTGLTWYLL